MGIGDRKINKTQKKHGISARDLQRKNLKELRCLYDVARISGAAERTLNERLEEIANILSLAFDYPDAICCRITIGEQEFKTANFKHTDNPIIVDIIVRGEKAGALEIGYTHTPSSAGGKLITKSESLLLNAIAERLGDLIEHRQAEDALQESEEKFSKAFHSSPAIISITDLKDGHIIDVNESFERFSGYTRAEALKLTTIETGRWTKPEERKRFLKMLKEHGSIRDMEIISRTKNGETRIGLLSAEIISLGGKPCIISVTQDITEQKQAQEFMQMVFQASPLGIYIFQDEKFRYANQQFQKVSGYNQQELLGLDPFTLVTPEDLDVVRSSTLHSLKGGNPYPCEYRIITKSGQIKWVMQTVSPIIFNGKKAMLGNVMDITERKYLERKVIEYEELDKMKGDLLATVSHELRTPLAAIKGYTTMIMDYYSKISKEETSDCLKSIDNSADKMIKMVDDLLDTSRMDSGLLVLDKFSVSITSVIKSVVAKASLRINDHRIVTELPDSLPPINLDIKRISQVLENLINNAAKYSPEGTEILISAIPKDREIEVSVTDHGPGVPAEELKNIFDRMYGAEKKVFTAVDGMGLSLHICQRLIEGHGGRIWAESTPGKGTSIRFTLPLVNP